MPSLTSNLYAFGEFSVDPQNRVLRLRDEPVALTPKAFELLLLLIQRGGQVVSKDELMKAVWPDSFVEESNLTQTIFMLRKALGETANQRYILKVQGRGYRFAAEVGTVVGNGDGDAFGGAATWHGPEKAVRPQDDSTNQPFEAASLPRHTRVDAPRSATPNNRRVALAFGALVLVATGLVLWLVPSLTRRANASGPIRSIAVLPLDNFSGDPSQEYFVDGMTDEVTTDLAKVSSLHVISRTSMMRYKGTKKGLPEIARELNVDGIVEGSVTRSGQRVRITAQLIHAPTDHHLWAETYERDLGDVLRLQSEVAEAIAQQVRAQVTPQQQARLRSARPVNPEAYEAYLRGRYYFTNQYMVVESLKKAKDYFEESIRKDPGFAQAYSGLANAYVYLALSQAWPRDRAYTSAKEALRKATELDESIGEIHDVLGVLAWRFDWDWRGAEREFRRAIELTPSYSCGQEDRALFLGFLGRRDDALAAVETSNRIDPGPGSTGAEAATNYQLRDYPALVKAGQKEVLSDPDQWNGHFDLGIGYEGSGKLLEAISEYQKAIELSNGKNDVIAYLAHAFVKIGKRAEAKKILLDLEQKSKSAYVSPYTMATVYAGLDERDKSLELLEQAFREKSLDASWHINADLRLDGLRSDPRFQALLRRVELLA
jgi:TolB-like protein/DNA-binding winged helix-turn-helix (wHTH) protein/Flp pilus assembly protein TadD